MATSASRAMTIQSHRLRDGFCELFVDANRFVYQSAATKS